MRVNNNNNNNLQGLSLLARSVLKASLRILTNSFLLEQITGLLKKKNPILEDQGFYSGFVSLPCLTSPVHPPRNSGKGPLPGATWSSRKAGSPLPAVGLPCYPITHIIIIINNNNDDDDNNNNVKNIC
jgi:hypothetical protein